MAGFSAAKLKDRKGKRSKRSISIDNLSINCINKHNNKTDKIYEVRGLRYKIIGGSNLTTKD